MSATIDPELRRAVIEIVDERFRELEVRRSDFIGLKEVVERLASAQVGTEEALKELAAAQKETEKALAELAAAQTRTDQQVGRLGDNIGFGLEDIARVVAPGYLLDRKSTRLNSSHSQISYAVFCLKKKNKRARASRKKTCSNSIHTQIDHIMTVHLDKTTSTVCLGTLSCEHSYARHD